MSDKSQGYPKEARVLKASDFKQTLDSGLKFVSRDFVAFAFPKVEAGETQFGIIVSKKLGNAVIRNRIKRRIREAFRRLATEDKPPQCRIVVIARQPTKDATQLKIATSLAYSFGHLKRRLQEQAWLKTC